MRLLLRWLISAGALAVTINVLQLPALQQWTQADWTGGAGAGAILMALIAVLVMGIVNAVIRPILRMLTMPLTCATLGLFSLVINGCMFWLVGWITKAFTVGFWGAVLGAIMMSVVSGIANHFIIAPEEKES